MGCWNGTCGVTNTAIHSGDEVQLIFMRKKGEFNSNSFCYSTDMFVPISFAVGGVYDDYGSIDSFDTPINNIVYDMVIDYLKRNCIEYSDDVINLDMLAEYVCTEKIDGVSFMLVHSGVWYELINYMGMSIPFFNYYGEDGVTLYNQYSSGYDEYITPCPIAAKHKIFVPTNNHNGFTSSFVRHLMPYVKHDLYTDEEVRTSAIDLCLFNDALSRSRKFWSAQSGAGSQNSDYDTLKIIGYHVERLSDEYAEKYE